MKRLKISAFSKRPYQIQQFGFLFADSFRNIHCQTVSPRLFAEICDSLFLSVGISQNLEVQPFHQARLGDDIFSAMDESWPDQSIWNVVFRKQMLIFLMGISEVAGIVTIREIEIYHHYKYKLLRLDVISNRVAILASLKASARKVAIFQNTWP
ncbi:hypothetical protein AVEN_130017-1 [Araneus ventricosus]|uniref:Uncharacterized protein n=1 Tax=Araneus ventricosus TaxID=182803 RepID=A0A4Y2XCV6_ARAVE|nr:hypothetical protein AVEN_130017-1 [Araneus ventricosus]